MEEDCAKHGMKAICYYPTFQQEGLNCINMGNKNTIYNPQGLSPNFDASIYPSGFQAVQNRFGLANSGTCASSKYHGPNNVLCSMATGMVAGGCPTYNKFLCAKQGASAAVAAGEDARLYP